MILTNQNIEMKMVNTQI